MLPSLSRDMLLARQGRYGEPGIRIPNLNLNHNPSGSQGAPPDARAGLIGLVDTYTLPAG